MEPVSLTADEDDVGCFWILDLQGMITHASDAENVFGWRVGCWVELWPAQHRATADACLSQAIAGRPGRFQVTLADAGGLGRVWDVRVRRISDAHGQFRYFAASASDVTERDRSLAMLEELAVRHQVIVSTAQDAIVVADEDGRVRAWNPAATRMFGYRAEDVLGRSIGLLVPDGSGQGDDGYLHQDRIVGLGSASGTRREVMGRRRDGSQFPLDLSLAAWRDGAGRRCFTGIMSDASERRAAVEALIESEERLRLLIEGIQDHAILMLDPDGRIVSWSMGAERISGWAEHEVLGRDVALVHTIEDAAAGRPRANLALARRHGAYLGEGRRRRKDGSVFEAEISITPLFDGRGGLRGYAEISQDVTLRREAEAELSRKNEELQAARLSADAASAAKSRFLAVMSHELRTPLTGVIGLSDLILSDEGDRPSERTTQRLMQLRSSADQLLRLLDDVLDLSKIEAGALRIETIRFDPRALMREVAQILEPVAAANGNRITLQGLDEAGPGALPPELMGDPTRLRQVLYNLVGNAAKFTRDGHVGIAACWSDSETAGLRIAVTDTGIGMTHEQMAGLFQPFVQGDASTTRKYGGTGLGLAISRRLVEAMGGEIAARSEPGRGTTMEVRLAALRPPATAALRPAPPRFPAVAASHAARILLAEDTEITRQIIAAMLRKAGHHVTEVEDGAAALAAVQAEAFDLVLMDMQMPVMDGPAATRAIRALPDARAAIPILALTADALPELRAEHMTSGLTGYLTKPVDWTALTHAIGACTIRQTMAESA